MINEKEIAMEVKRSRTRDGRPYYHYCPKCEKQVYFTNGRDEMYCMHCGQKITNIEKYSEEHLKQEIGELRKSLGATIHITTIMKDEKLLEKLLEMKNILSDYYRKGKRQ